MNRETIQPYIDKGMITERAHPEHSHIRIYNYTNQCQIDRAWDDVTLQCRGLIMNIDTGEVLARPFNKFFNLEERDHLIPEDEIPHVFEKYDGSLGILYWIHDVPYIATRGSFESEQAIWATKYLREHVDHAAFNQMFTHLFEIIYPQNRIVVNYDWSGLVLIGVRHTATGMYTEPDLFVRGITRPEYHKITTLYDLQKIERDNAEGFVVWYPSNDLFIKLKHDEYKRLHKLVTGVNEKVVWELLRAGKGTQELLENVPDEFYKWVESTAADLTRTYNNILNNVALKHGEVRHMHTRKDQALALKGYRYDSVVFAMLDGKDYGDIIWRMIKPKVTSNFTEEI